MYHILRGKGCALKWSSKVLLDAFIATVVGCLLGGILFALYIRRHTFDAGLPVESLLALAQTSIAYTLFTLPFSLFFALWLTIPIAFGLASLERSMGHPPRLLLQLLLPVGLSALLILPPLLTLQTQQADASGLQEDPAARKALLDMQGSFLLAVFFGSHILLHGGATTIVFHLLRKRRLSQTRDSIPPPIPAAATGQDG